MKTVLSNAPEGGGVCSALIVCIVVMVSALFLAGCGTERPGHTATPLSNYSSVSVRQVQRQASYRVPREFIGIVQAPQRTNLSFDSAGSLQELTVDEGDHVEKGQKLARLDQSVLEAQLDNARAAKRDLEARLSLNKKDLVRLQKLREKDYAAQSQEDMLLAQGDSLAAQIDAASASIDSLERQLDKKNLYAPFDATIAARMADQGAVISHGQPVFQLLESGELEVRVGIPVRLARKISPGDEYAIRIERGEYQARIKSLGSSVNRVSKTIAAELEIISDNLDVFDGQIARLILSESREQSGFWISVDSLVAGPRGTWDVYILTEPSEHIPEADNKALKLIERRKVNVEYVGDGGAYISYGLVSGDWVVDNGIHKIAAGQLVEVGRKVKAAEVGA